MPAFRIRLAVRGLSGFLLAVAVAGGGDSEAVLLEPFVVTASRLELPPGQVAVATSVFDVEELDDSPALTADDFLRQVPEFSLFRRTSSLAANPTTQGFTLRGIGPSGTSRGLVLYDGAPLNDAFGGWVYWSKIDLRQVERIEVVRGGGSAAWGNAALSGVIQVLPTPIERTGGNVSVLAGSQGTHGISSRLQSVHGNWGVALEGRVFQTDGYRRVREDQRGAVDIRANSRHETLSTILEHHSPAGAFFRGRLTFFDERRDNGTPLTGNSTEAWRWQHRYRFPEDAGEGVTTWTGFAERSRYASTFSSVSADRNSENLVLDQFRVPSITAGTGLQHERPWGDGQSATVGADFRWIDGETNERVVMADRLRKAGGEQVFAGVFFENLSPVGGNTTVSLALRADLWHNYGGFQETRPFRPSGGGTRDEFGDRTEILLSPRIGATTEMNSENRLRASAYQGFRAPTINELYRPFQVGSDRTFANENLDPEILIGGEIGWEWTPDGAFSSDLTLFWNDVRDSVANVTLGPNDIGGSDRQRQNLERIRVRGIEWEGRYRPEEFLELFLRHALLDARIRRAGNQPELEGNRLAQVSEHQGTVGLRLQAPDRVRLTAQLRYEGPRYEDDTNRRRLGSFAVLDLMLRRDLGKRTQVHAGIENVFDRRYVDGRPGEDLATLGQPRLLTAGATASF